MPNNITTEKVRQVYESGIFDKMVGTNRENGEPPQILKKFFTGDIDYIENKLEKSGKVLEIGCGFGRLLPYLAKVSREVVGIDFSKLQVKKSRALFRNNKNVKVELMSAEKLKFKDGIFDTTACLNCSLGNMPGIESLVISEMKRVTKKGGKVIVRVFADNKKVRTAQHKNYKRLGFTEIKDLGKAVVTREGFYSSRFSKQDLNNLFANAGLKAEIKADGEAGYIAEATK